MMSRNWEVSKSSKMFEIDRLIISGSQVRVLLGPPQNKRLTGFDKFPKSPQGSTGVAKWAQKQAIASLLLP